MTTYTFRPVSVGVFEHAWMAVEAASAVDAIQTHHDRNLNARWSHSIRVPVDGTTKHQHVHFAVYEVKGVDKPLVSRIYESRIERRGGVRTRDQPTVAERLTQIARALEWSHPAEDLLVSGGPWEGEEAEWK